MSGNYDDIINLPHHVSKTRPQMPMSDRAAQFSPFAALTGHDAAIQETARLTAERIELDENEIELLNSRLQDILSRQDEQSVVSITYFQPDEKKSGGAYVTATGVIKKVDEYQQAIYMMDGTPILVDSIFAIDSQE